MSCVARWIRVLGPAATQASTPIRASRTPRNTCRVSTRGWAKAIDGKNEIKYTDKIYKQQVQAHTNRKQFQSNVVRAKKISASVQKHRGSLLTSDERLKKFKTKCPDQAHTQASYQSSSKARSTVESTQDSSEWDRSASQVMML